MLITTRLFARASAEPAAAVKVLMDTTSEQIDAGTDAATSAADVARLSPFVRHHLNKLDRPRGGERRGGDWASTQLPRARFCGWIASPRASMSTNWVIRRARVSARLAFAIR